MLPYSQTLQPKYIIPKRNNNVSFFRSFPSDFYVDCLSFNCNNVTDNCSLIPFQLFLTLARFKLNFLAMILVNWLIIMTNDYTNKTHTKHLNECSYMIFENRTKNIILYAVWPKVFSRQHRQMALNIWMNLKRPMKTLIMLNGHKFGLSILYICSRTIGCSVHICV